MQGKTTTFVTSNHHYFRGVAPVPKDKKEIKGKYKDWIQRKSHFCRWCDCLQRIGKRTCNKLLEIIEFWELNKIVEYDFNKQKSAALLYTTSKQVENTTFKRNTIYKNIFLIKDEKTCRGNIIKLYWRVLKTHAEGNILYSWIWRWEKVCKNNFIENESRKTNKHVKTCQPHLYSGKCNSRPWDTVSQPFNWQNVRNLKIPIHIWRTHRSRGSLFFFLWFVKLVQPLWKAILCSLVRLNITFNDLALSFLCLGSFMCTWRLVCKNAHALVA